MIKPGNTGNNRPFLRRLECQFKKFVRLFNLLGRNNLRHPQIDLAELIKGNQPLHGAGRFFLLFVLPFFLLATATFFLLLLFFTGIQAGKELRPLCYPGSRRQHSPAAGGCQGSRGHGLLQPQGCGHLVSGPRHDRPHYKGYQAQTFRQEIKHCIKPFFFTRISGQLPGRIGHNIAVQLSDNLPHFLQSLVKGKAIHGRLVCGNHCLHGSDQGPILIGDGPLIHGRHPAGCIFSNHGQGPGKEIAQVIGQVGISTANNGLAGKGGVKTKAHLPQEKITDRINTVFLHQLSRPDHIAYGFGHLGLIHIPVAMHMQTFIGRQPHGQDHGRPVDGMGLKDILGNNMFGC